MKGILYAVAFSFMLSTPLFVHAQQTEDSELMQAREQARKDAGDDINKMKWVAIGCFSLVIGMNHAQSASIPPPNPERLLGKSHSYIKAYEEAYYAQVRKTRITYSIIGCVGGTIIYTIVIVQGVHYVEGSSSDANSCCSGQSGGNGDLIWSGANACCISGK